MASTIHSNARTTPQIRRELQEAPPGVSDPELARRYGITRMTVRKWRYRRDVEDRSHCPKRLHTTLTPEQEAIVVQVREVALLSLDDLLIVAREFLNPDLSRAALARCLRRHGVADVRALQRERDGEPEEPAHKPGTAGRPGPNVLPETRWRYMDPGAGPLISVSLEAFSSIADRLAEEHGALTFFDAYAWFVDEYDQHISEETPDPLDCLAESVQKRTAAAPPRALSVEFYFNLFLVLILFYLSQVLAEESEQRVMDRIGALEQALLGQIEALSESGAGAIYLVDGKTIELRDGPSEDHEIHGVLRPYQKVHQIESQHDWVRIEYFDHASNEMRKGWVHCGDLSTEERIRE